eukprot:1943569-Rhodomonas_salina.2
MAGQGRGAKATLKQAKEAGQAPVVKAARRSSGSKPARAQSKPEPLNRLLADLRRVSRTLRPGADVAWRVRAGCGVCGSDAACAGAAGRGGAQGQGHQARPHARRKGADPQDHGRDRPRGAASASAPQLLARPSLAVAAPMSRVRRRAV